MDKQTQKRAAEASKSGSIFYAVYVLDSGPEVFNAEQMRRYSDCVIVDAAFLNGKQIAVAA